MGASLVYLEKPNKEIEFDEGEDDRIKFAAGSMQGWRINMVSKAPDSLNLRRSLNHTFEYNLTRRLTDSIFGHPARTSPAHLTPFHRKTLILLNLTSTKS